MPAESMRLFQQIAAWDGKSVDGIEKILLEHYHDLGFCRQLVQCLDSPELVSGATWLLKNYLERGGRISKREVASVHRRIQHLVHWTDQLHFLQCAEYWSVPDRYRQSTLEFIRGCLQHDRPFVRAWAHHGLFWFANQYPEYQDEVCKLFQQTLKSEKASVKARVRNLMKRGSDL